ncbi:hypothetical protein M0R45_013331 [Rubus argutus]|uniref:Protein IQ-DOMAIN 1 n=1 Tax=Rubus argutus TaxID=59490 RepID=A0AAW1XJR2_RUBAR
MGSGNWFKAFNNLRKAKFGSSKRVKLGSLDMPVEDIAAIRIQTAFRAHVARKALRRLKGIVRLQMLTQAYPVRKQATTTLSYLHSWSRIQTDIRTRRLCMVTEGRIKQKKLENQIKLEAKLHDIEVEWSGGSETMDDILSRIYQREEAAVKRERAMAYAFSHQWRANCSQSQGLGSYELGKATWGWSWKERWIAARPWESRVQSPTPKKLQTKQASKVGKNINSPTPKTSVSVKLPSPNGKGPTRPRRLSYTADEEEKPVPHAEGINLKRQTIRNEHLK